MTDVFKKYFEGKDDYSIPEFDDVLNYDSAMDRNMYLGEIVEGTGVAIDTVIRFWNRMDDENNIPVEERKPIKLYIDSPGGDIVETMTMYDAIKNSKTPVWGIVTGGAYSGGFFTLLACHKRIGYKHSSYLYHEGSAVYGGTANNFNNFSDFYKNTTLKHLKEITLGNTHFTEEEYADMRKDDVWLDADKALEKGVIDEITEVLY